MNRPPPLPQLSRWVPLVGLLALACAPDAGDGPPAVESSAAPIVGGALEPGHPAVGALAHVVGERYNGPFCTATLIDPGWILTAAHCLEGLRASGQPAQPANVRFVVGPDARARDNQRPRDGTAHRIRAIHPHPSFVFGGLLQTDDLALYALETPLDDVPPLALARGPLEPALGAQILYVGYGADDGLRRTGQGLKRARALRLEAVFLSRYLTAQPDGGVCYGDSGGPGLLPVAGGYQVVGVNSTVTGQTPAGGQCREQSSQIRVDAYQTWIDQVMTGAGGCEQAPERCACAEACGPAGVCDPLGCDPDGCRVLAECLSPCGNAPACVLGCWDAADRAAHAHYADVITCLQASRCAANDAACIERVCGGPIAACTADYDPGPGGPLSCAEAVACGESCAGDAPCTRSCYEAAQPLVRPAYDALVACAQRACPGAAGSALQACLRGDCAPEARACDAGEPCDLLGGACPAGSACALAPWGGTRCAPSADRALGAACAPAPTPCVGLLCLPGLPCADGLICADSGAGSTCLPGCFADADCPHALACARPAGTPVGACVPCPDRDGDGHCDAVDCAPDDPTRHPGALEICGDGVDQDCDGEDPPCADQGPPPDQGPRPDQGAPPDEGGLDHGITAPDAEPPAQDASGDPPTARDRGIPTADGAADPTADPTVLDGGCVAGPGGPIPPPLGALLLLLGLSRPGRRARAHP